MKDVIIAFLHAAAKLIIDSMTLTVDDLKVTQADIDIVIPLMQALSCIGMGITIILFLTEINQKLAFDGSNMTLKTLLAPLLKLFAALCIMKKGSDIVGWCISASLGLISEGDLGGDMSTLETTINDYATSMADTISVLGILVLVALLIPILVAFILGIICRLIWWYKSITYKIQVMWQVVVAPVGFADIYNGLNSQTLRYIKRIIACGVEGMAMLALPSITCQLALATLMEASSETDAIKLLLESLSGFFQLAICPIVALGALSVVKQVTKEAFGA